LRGALAPRQSTTIVFLAKTTLRPKLYLVYVLLLRFAYRNDDMRIGIINTLLTFIYYRLVKLTINFMEKSISKTTPQNKKSKLIKILWLIAFAILVVFFPIDNRLNALAEIRIEPKVGTQGLGLDVSQKFSVVGLRLSNNYLNLNKKDDVSDISYKVDAKMLNVGLLLDVYPLTDGLRLTAGGFYSNNDVDLKANLNGPIKIGTVNFTTSEVGTFDGSFKQKSKFSPYVGFGTSKSYKFLGGLGLNFDVGARFAGNYDVNLKSSGGTLSGNPTLENQIKAEEDSIKDDLKRLKFYPVVSFGLTLAF
jgi:hypothetical protein